MKVIFKVRTRYVGSDVEEEVEYLDGTDEEDIQKDFENWVWENIDSGWSIEED